MCVVVVVVVVIVIVIVVVVIIVIVVVAASAAFVCRKSAFVYTMSLFESISLFGSVS